MTKDDRDYILAVIQDAENHLSQYRTYAETMRAIGRGMVPSSPHSPEAIAAGLRIAKSLIAAEAQ